MRVAVTVGEATFGGWSSQSNKSVALSGLSDMAFAEPAGFVILTATLEGTFVYRNAQRLQACDIGGVTTEGTARFAPLLIVTWAETPSLDNLRTVREYTLP
jgi:hypothetical protein